MFQLLSLKFHRYLNRQYKSVPMRVIFLGELRPEETTVVIVAVDKSICLNLSELLFKTYKLLL